MWERTLLRDLMFSRSLEPEERSRAPLSLSVSWLCAGVGRLLVAGGPISFQDTAGEEGTLEAREPGTECEDAGTWKLEGE